MGMYIAAAWAASLFTAMLKINLRLKNNDGYVLYTDNVLQRCGSLVAC